MQACSCDACASACRNDPGRFLPGEIDRLAAYLKISVEELWREYLILKKLSLKGSFIWVPAPAKFKTKFRYVTKPGHRAKDYHEKERGRCVFLNSEGLCTIHAVKPYECGAYMGCKHTFQGRPYKAAQVEAYFFKHWKGHQDELPELPSA